MPPSWHPVPAFVNHDMPQAGHSSLRKEIRIGRGPRSCYDHCRRAIPHCSGDGAASIPKSGPEIKNRCTQEGVNGEKLTSIPKFGPEIKNHFSSKSVLQAGHSSLQLRRLESDTDLVVATAAVGETILPLHRFPSLGLKSRITARRWV